MANPIDLPILDFKLPKQWEGWLAKNYGNENGIWLKFFKKASGVESINYDQALDVALCFGWIDGQSKGFDEKSWIQKFTPRRKRSIWSKRNIEHIGRLTKLGKMQPSGIAAYQAAKADGRLAQAYDSPANMQIPPDFLKELSKNKTAEKFFQTLNKSNVYAITWRLQTAKKKETRQKRMQQILEQLTREEKLH